MSGHMLLVANTRGLGQLMCQPLTSDLTLADPASQFYSSVPSATADKQVCYSDWYNTCVGVCTVHVCQCLHAHG